MLFQAVLPKTQVVDSDGCCIAYQVIGDGPDLLFVPGFLSHLDLQWSDPWFGRALHRLASFSRLIIFDQRGVGLSDPAPGVPGLEQRVDDIRAVLDAVGSERAALLGHCNGGPASLLFAATHPDRVSSLVVLSSYAKGEPDGEHPGALTPEAYERAMEAIDNWGEGRSVRLFTPTVAGGRWHERMFATLERAAVSPGTMRAAYASAREIDITDALPAVRAPTLVVHATDDFMSVEAARYIADRVPDARFVEVPGPDHIPFVGPRSGEYLDVIEGFLTGRPNVSGTNQNLMTVLFTDIVGSTQHAGRLGDRAWRDLIERHDVLVRDQLERFDGLEVKTTGDGVMAAFDGPERAVRAAHAIREGVGELGLELRAGLHAGPCELSGDDLVGLTVNIAARIVDLAGPGEVLVSDAVRKLAAGSALTFASRGTHRLKGVPGRWSVFAAGGDPSGREVATAWAAGDGPARDAARWRDRALVRAARVAPWLTRSATRLASRSGN